MKSSHDHHALSRRKFFRLAVTSGVAAAVAPSLSGQQVPAKQEKPKTNLADAMKHPRNKNSMPGRYPGLVARVVHDRCISENKIDEAAAYAMVEQGMLALTGAGNLHSAWKKFVKPGEKIGLKINPVAGKILTTSHEIVKAVIHQLELAGIARSDIVLWDRRAFQLTESDFTAENYPGIIITGTEQQDASGSYYDADGKLYGEKMIDTSWYFWADVEGEYDAYTIPYMVNGGKYSYFTRICTQMVDKIINIPIMKNAGTTATLALKNLAFGSVSNTGRLHQQLWAETCAQVCAFPPLRDKVVLNIVDGIRGCFDGGPGANPQFFTDYKTVLVATDPVAIDRVGYEIILKKRIEEKLQKEESPGARRYMDLAQELQLGIADLEKIRIRDINLS
jgi:uncharacterized protein (DUF362 family)